MCRYHFPDGSILDARSDPGAMAAEVERFSPGQGQAWRRYFEWGERCWAASERAFLSRPLDLRGLARRQASLSDLFASGPGQTLAGLARRFFTDPRLIQYACRYATYLGSDPYQAPAAVGCIPYLEHARGAWYVDGGLARLRERLARLLADLGVVIHTGATVSRVLTAGGQPAAGPGSGWPVRGPAARGRAGGVLVAGERVPADSWSAARTRPGCTGISTHHGRCAAGSPGSGRPPPDSWCWPRCAGAPPVSPTTTSSSPRTTALSSRTSSAATGRPTTRRSMWAARSPGPGECPARDESLTLLVNVPAGNPGNWGRSPLTTGNCCWASWTPRDSASATRCCSPRRSPGRLRAPLRRLAGLHLRDLAQRPPGAVPPPRATGARLRLYLVGGSVHPGGGLPLVIIGSRIVADLVTEDLATGRI